MKTAVIGKGKMGRDIFNHFFQYDGEFVLICRSQDDVEKLTNTFEKQLKKMLNRGYLSEVEYDEKMKSFLVSTDYNDLADCDLVIESVVEDLQVKQNIFEKIESIVKPECILATNTSSIRLNRIFENCATKNRCIGMHFFFPVKITRTVEINRTRFTEQKYVDIVRDLLIKANKHPLELKEEANMILSKMLLNLISEAYIIYQEKFLSIEEIDKVLKENLVTFGLFEIIDATGIHIILESRENFISERYEKLYEPFYIKGKQLMEEGYGGGAGNKGLLAYEQEHPLTFNQLDENSLCDYKQNIVLRLQSILINELAYLIENKYVERDGMNEAVKEILGFSEDPISMLRGLGEEKIKECLLNSYQKYQDKIYQPLDLTVLGS